MLEGMTTQSDLKRLTSLTCSGCACALRSCVRARIQQEERELRNAISNSDKSVRLSVEVGEGGMSSACVSLTHAQRGSSITLRTHFRQHRQIKILHYAGHGTPDGKLAFEVRRLCLTEAMRS